MITGSSAFKSQERAQITSPRLRVTVSDNYYVNDTIKNFYEAGGSYNPFISFDANNLNGIMWRDMYVTFTDAETSVLTRDNVRVYTVDFPNPNVEEVQEIFAGVSCPNSRIGHVYNLGNTIMITYVSTLGNTFTITNIYSSGATSWGGTEILYAGSSQIEDVVSFGSTKAYFLEMIERTDSVLPFTANYKLRRLVKEGSWGATTIEYPKISCFGASIFNSNGGDNCIWGAQIGQFDRLGLVCSDPGTSRTITNRFNHGIRILELDDINVTKEFDLIDTLNPDSQLKTTHLAYGGSLYYLSFFIGYNYFITTYGYTYSYTEQLNQFIIKTPDLLEWDMPVLYGLTHPRPYAIVPGISRQPEISLLSQNSMYHGKPVQIYNRSGQYDISSNVIEYTNQNNKKITLTLGNYK